MTAEIFLKMTKSFAESKNGKIIVKGKDRIKSKKRNDEVKEMAKMTFVSSQELRDKTWEECSRQLLGDPYEKFSFYVYIVICNVYRTIFSMWIRR